MKPKFFLPLISLVLLLLSLVYALSYKSQTRNIPTDKVPTGIQYMDMSASQATFTRDWITADSMVLWVRGYQPYQDMRMEYKDGLLMKRSYLQPGTRNSVMFYHTFEYSALKYLKKVRQYAFDTDKIRLKHHSTVYYRTDWYGNIKSSYAQYVNHPTKVDQREYCWKNGNMYKIKNYNHRGQIKSIWRITYDQHVNPMYGLNLFPDDPQRQSWNNPVKIHTKRFVRGGTHKVRVREKQYMYHELGATMGELHPKNGKPQYYYLYE